jgi:DnaJ-class molecular chaperone
MVDNQKFYKYLNLGTDASSKEIKESYQKLTRIIHPDKQVSGTSDQNKQLSEQIFIKITYAKEILLNPATKYIYDNFGEQGINRISGKKHLLNYEIKTESDKIVIIT